MAGAAQRKRELARLTALVEGLQEQIDDLRGDVDVVMKLRQPASEPAAPRPTPAKVAAAKKSTQ